MWTFFSALALAYAALFAFKLYWHETSEWLYERFGLDIGLFQIKISSSARGRWVTNIPTIRKCKYWYKVGTFVSVLLVVPSVIFLVSNLGKLISILFSSKEEEAIVGGKTSHGGSRPEQDLIFQPVIPGVTFPLSEVGVYGFSLFVCTVFHELGHALAADCHDVKLLGYGVMIFFLIPAAFVDMSTSELTSLTNKEQLKIYTAGVWHNLVLAFVAFVVMLCLPTLASPGYYHHSMHGITVLDVNPNSTVSDGLHFGDVITMVNDCKVSKVSDFYSCLRLEAKSRKGHCVNVDKVEEMECADCCSKNSSYLPFKGLVNAAVCLPVRETLDLRTTFCQEEVPCQETEDCLTPDLAFPQETLWHVRRRNNGQKDFLYIGSLSDLLYGVETLTDYVAASDMWPLRLPLTMEKSLYYITSFSLALALINIIPCAMLDGQYVIKSLLGLCPYKTDCLAKVFIHSGSFLLIANLGLTFVVLKS